MPVFKATQFIKTDKLSCWDFFSDPANLALITPPDMNFRVVNPDPMPVMHEGLIIRYKVSPLLRIPLNWVTEIRQVKKYESFVDIQLSGPFRRWHHQHSFMEVPGGIEMTDVVNYELPFGIIGEVAALWMVRKRIGYIFSYRKTIIETRFS